MAEKEKLELLLEASDKMSPKLKKLLIVFRELRRESGKAVSGLDQIGKKLSQPIKAGDGLSKTRSEVGRLTADLNRTRLAYARLQKQVSGGIKTPKITSPSGKVGNSRPSKSAGDSSFLDDAIITATGAALATTSRVGVKAAMSQQEAFTQLRNTFYRSSLSAAELNGQMRQAEKLAISLGNDLPGTTSDYVQLITTLKQGGLTSDAALGAAKATAYLAVTNKEDPTETAKRSAQFGQIFGLKTEDEYLKALDLMSRFKTSKGIDSTELVEMSKYFGGRTGTSLGMTGIGGAESSLRLLAFLREKTGMESTMVGEGTSSFFREYLKAKQGRKRTDPLGEVKKLTGIDLELFDQKGKYVGNDKAIEQFSRIKGKLTDEQLSGIGGKLAGDSGAAMFTAMVNYGDQWKAFNKDANETISLLDNQANAAKNLSQQTEALMGSLENLGAEGFKPLLPLLSSVAVKANDTVGKLTDLAKAYPATAGTTAGVLSLAAAVLTLKGGASILSKFTSRAGEVAELGAAAETAATRTSKLRGSLLSMPTLVKIGFLIETMGFTWEQIQKFLDSVKEYKKASGGLDEAGKEQSKTFVGKQQMYQEQGRALSGTDYQTEATSALDLLQEGKNRQLEYALDPKRMGWYDWIYTLGGALSNPFYKNAPTTGDVMTKPEYRDQIDSYKSQGATTGKGIYSDIYSRVAYEKAGAENLQRRAPVLNDPNVMAAFRAQAPQALNLNDQMKGSLETMLAKAFPASFAQSSEMLAQQQGALAQETTDLTQAFSFMKQPTSDLGTAFVITNNASQMAALGLSNFTNSANDAAIRLNNVQVNPIQMPMIGIPAAPGRSKGGSATKGRPMMVGEVGTELFIPDTNGRIVPNAALRSGGNAASSPTIVNHFNPTVNVAPGVTSQEIASVRRELSQMYAQFNRELSPDRVARRVAYATERDSERM